MNTKIIITTLVAITLIAIIGTLIIPQTPLEETNIQQIETTSQPENKNTPPPFYEDPSLNEKPPQKPTFKDPALNEVQQTHDENTLSTENIIPNETPPETILPKVPCEGKQYTITPVDLTKVIEITPLGNFNPPSHTQPTPHIYLHLKENKIPLKSPADVTIIKISSNQDITQGQLKADYGITFQLCDNITGYFMHIKEITPEIKNLLKTTSFCDETNDYKYCENNQVNYPLKAGQLIGYVGNDKQNNFDFGTQSKTIQSQYANPDRYYSKGDMSLCPLDLYPEETKSKLYDLLARTDRNCGKINYDINETLQGHWFYDNAKPILEWEDSITLGYDNEQSERQIIVTSGIFTDFGRLEFIPKNTGTTNRNFAQVTPSETTYCYEGINDKPWKDQINGRVLIQLTSETELQIEQQNGTCPGTFTNPTTYQR